MSKVKRRIPILWYVINALSYACDLVGTSFYRLRDRAYMNPIFEDRDMVSPLLMLLHKHSNPQVLDVGCGNGDLALLCAKLGASVEGFDVSQERLNLAKKRADRMNLENVEFSVFDAELGLPYNDSSFDIVVCCHVFEHLINRKNLLSEISRILKPYGNFILMAPLLTDIKRLLSKVCRFYFSDRTHVLEFTTASIIHELRIEFDIDKCYKYGFDPLLQRLFTPFFALFPSQVTKINRSLRDKLGAANIAVICTKLAKSTSRSHRKVQ